jgi:hypothetical protein
MTKKCSITSRGIDRGGVNGVEALWNYVVPLQVSLKGTISEKNFVGVLYISNCPFWSP